MRLTVENGQLVLNDRGQQMATAAVPPGDCTVRIVSDAGSHARRPRHRAGDPAAVRRPSRRSSASTPTSTRTVTTSPASRCRSPRTPASRPRPTTLKILAGLLAVLAAWRRGLGPARPRRARRTARAAPGAQALVVADQPRRRRHRRARGVGGDRQPDLRRRLHPGHRPGAGVGGLHRQLLPLVQRPRGAVRLVLRALRAVDPRRRLDPVDAAAVADHGDRLLDPHQPRDCCRAWASRSGGRRRRPGRPRWCSSPSGCPTTTGCAPSRSWSSPPCSRFCAVERGVATRRLAPVALGLLAAAFAVAATPTGLIAVAPFLAAARPLWRLVIERVRFGGWLPVLAPIFAAGLLVLVADLLRPDVGRGLGGDAPAHPARAELELVPGGRALPVAVRDGGRRLARAPVPGAAADARHRRLHGGAAAPRQDRRRRARAVAAPHRLVGDRASPCSR